MPHHIRQRLLHNPVRGLLDLGRRFLRGGVYIQADVRPCPAGVIGQGRHAGNGGPLGRAEWNILPEDAQQLADLRQRLLARGFDGFQGRPELPWVLLPQVQRDRSPDVDQGQRMRHHVMDIPGKAQPVFVTGSLFGGLTLAVPFGHPLAPQTDALTEQDQDGEPGGTGEGPQQAGFIATQDRTQRHGTSAQANNCPGEYPLSRRRSEDQGDGEGQDHRAPRVAKGQVHRGGRQRDRKHHQRRTPAEGQGGRSQQQQGEGEEIQGPVVRLTGRRKDGAHHLDHGHHHHNDGGGWPPETALHAPSSCPRLRNVVCLTT